MDKLILFGAGEEGKKWLQKIGDHNIWAFADSNISKTNKKFCGKKVMSVDELKQCNESIIIFISASKKYYDEIKKIIKEIGKETQLITSPYLPEILRVKENAFFDSQCEFEGANYIGRCCSIRNVYMGYASYLANNVKLQRTKIGRYSAIAEGVSLIVGQHPTKEFVSIHPAFYSPTNSVSYVHYVKESRYDEFRYTDNGYIAEIGNDVWIGKNVQIMEGIKIGDGAIVAAGAIVTKNVEPYSIIGGIPAKLIKKRFSEDNIQFLKDLKWWDKSEEWIKEKARFFYDVNELKKHCSIGDS